MEFTLRQVANLINGKVEGDANAKICSLGKIEQATPNDLTFLANINYENYIYTTQAVGVIVSEDFKPKKEINTNLIRVVDPYSAFTKVLEKYQNIVTHDKFGIEDPSFVSPSAIYGNDIYIGAFAYISNKCELGNNVKIYPNVFIGENCKIANNTILYSGVKIYPNTVIGENCTIHAGAVIGCDGFGFAPEKDGTYKAIPQIGNVVIKDNVSIGANTTIDRATMGSTIIEHGVKLDNLVQIAHNVEIGKNTVMAAQVGIAGSTKVGASCKLGGQSALGGHITVAEGTVLGGKAASINSISEPNKIWVGQPAQQKEQLINDIINIKRIPKIQKQLKELKEKILNLSNDLTQK